MNFQLVERAGRIVLLSNAKDSDEVLQTITADSWIAARLKVNESKFAYYEGYGWIRR